MDTHCALSAREWITRCSAQLQQRWRTVNPDQLDDLANDLWNDDTLRRLPPELAATRWLSRGVLMAASTTRRTAAVDQA